MHSTRPWEILVAWLFIIVKFQQVEKGEEAILESRNCLGWSFEVAGCVACPRWREKEDILRAPDVCGGGQRAVRKVSTEHRSEQNCREYWTPNKGTINLQIYWIDWVVLDLSGLFPFGRNRVSDAVGLSWGMRIFISNKFPFGAAEVKTVLSDPLLYLLLPCGRGCWWHTLQPSMPPC